MMALFSKQEIKQNLMGCFEITLFMRRGVERFSETKHDAIKSFLVPIVFLPLVLCVTISQSTGYPPLLLAGLHGVKIVVTLALFISVIYLFSKHYDRREHFFQCVTAMNWMEIPLIILILPALVALFLGIQWESIESYAVFVTIVVYIYAGFVLTHALRIPWEMGAFLAIVGLCIDQTGYNIVEMIRDSLVMV